MKRISFVSDPSIPAPGPPSWFAGTRPLQSRAANLRSRHINGSWHLGTESTAVVPGGAIPVAAHLHAPSTLLSWLLAGHRGVWTWMHDIAQFKSEERPSGQECVSTCRFRGVNYT